jgi:hypothetical protein
MPASGRPGAPPRAGCGASGGCSTGCTVTRSFSSALAVAASRVHSQVAVFPQTWHSCARTARGGPAAGWLLAAGPTRAVREQECHPYKTTASSHLYRNTAMAVARESCKSKCNPCCSRRRRRIQREAAHLARHCPTGGSAHGEERMRAAAIQPLARPADRAGGCRRACQQIMLAPIIYERDGVELCASSVLGTSFSRRMLYHTHAHQLAFGRSGAQRPGAQPAGAARRRQELSGRRAGPCAKAACVRVRHLVALVAAAWRAERPGSL